ncbi:MAG: exodeoxyribonuclease VII small subunit [Oscillospiraceae bacterium]|nr:exodeoxyribonuclease VII small subunit [Oscillospiraceae bacterium]
MKKMDLSFEQSMERLDTIVKQLEKGEAPLNESLKLFEEGTALIAYCGKMLDEAEQKIAALKKGENGEPVETPFEGGE